MLVWRLARAIHHDLSGGGGLLYQGRWNDAGISVVYSSASLALSILERRFHSVRQLKDDVSIQMELPERFVEILAPPSEDWKQDMVLTRRLGSEWLRSRRSLCLRVPSAIVSDFNYLINPLHAAIDSVKVVSVTPLK